MAAADWLTRPFLPADRVAVSSCWGAAAPDPPLCWTAGFIYVKHRSWVRRSQVEVLASAAATACRSAFLNPQPEVRRDGALQGRLTG